MTGLERLRDMSEFYEGLGSMVQYGGEPMCDVLHRIAADIEREQDALVKDSPYEALPPDEREAIAWVREHGGLAAVRTSCGHADNRRVELCAALGIDTETGWSEAMAAMRPRLMPEGMEWLLEVWPKWSNGEYCKFGDWWTADKYGDYEPKQLRRLVFYTPEQLREWEQDEGDNFGYEWDFMRPSDTTYRPDKAEPPAPKVLDADGAEIRVGDKLYDTDTGCARIVRAVNASGTIEFEGCEDRGWFANRFTHERPAIGADGELVKSGDTVWCIATDEQLGDMKVSPESFAVYRDELTVYCVYIYDGEPWASLMETISDVKVHYLTHERPESWGSLEDDATLPAATYCERMGIEVEEGCSFVEPMARDLVRRARALAEKEG